MRVKGSGKPPELTLLEGQKFHLFLSREPLKNNRRIRAQGANCC